MKIKRKKIDIEPEKDLLTGLITSDKFIREIYPILNIQNLQVNYVKIIAKWCVDYYLKYGEAPKENIQDIFRFNIREKKIDETMIDLVEDFLILLSEDYKSKGKYNDKHLRDESEKYLAKRNLTIMTEDVHAYLSVGDIAKAELSVANHCRTEIPLNTSIDIFQEIEKVIDIVMSHDEELFSFPGVLGRVVGPLSRGDFLSFIAPMKRGKSYWLVELAIFAALQQLKVLFVSLEMPKKQMLRRLFQNVLGQTKRKKHDVVIPYFDKYNNIKYRTIEKGGLTAEEMRRKTEKLEMVIKTGGIRLLTYPSYGANIETIRNEIYNLAHYNSFFPDIVVIDYLDILGLEPSSPKEPRHKLDHTWKIARGLAQEIDGLVVTVSQSSRATFNKNVEEGDISEDIRKMAHVTHMIALNQSRQDKKDKVMRLSVLANREEEFHTDDEIAVLYNYGISKAYLDSRFLKDTNLSESDE